jgi:Uncharacterized protein conserved in bacteria (DUF2252)
MEPAELVRYGQLCGWTLARTHARSGDRVAIASYLGSGRAFDDALAVFAEAYADQNQRDYDDLVRDVKAGKLAVQLGVYFAARAASICSEAVWAPSSSPIRSASSAARFCMRESSMAMRIAEARRSGVSFLAGSGSGPAPAQASAGATGSRRGSARSGPHHRQRAARTRRPPQASRRGRARRVERPAPQMARHRRCSRR